ncbi:hypothetical protein AS200_09380 [Streptomyces sp. CdTB01]|nr:hypothetical protein AS200_09380 [Streptomyces sp. CdTB01]
MSESGSEAGTVLSDRVLVERAVRVSDERGRRDALEQIVDRYLRRVLATVAKRVRDAEVAADVTQEAFAVAFTDLAAGKPPNEPDKLGSWLVGIAMNRLRDHWKVQRQTREWFTDLAGDTSFDDVPAQGAGRTDAELLDDPGRLEQARRHIAAVVDATLDGTDRELYDLYFGQAWDVGKITERVGASLASGVSGRAEKTVRNRITEIKTMVAEGFHAYLLVQGDRTRCPLLSAITDRYPAGFGVGLRDHVIKHVRNCASCGSCAECPSCRIKTFSQIQKCTTSAACQNCGVCAREDYALRADWAPALVLVLYAKPVRNEILRSISHVMQPVALAQEAVALHNGAGDSVPEGARRHRRWRRKAAIAASAAAVVAVGTLFLTRPGTDSVPVAATMPSIAYADDTGLHLRVGADEPSEVAPVAVGNKITSMIWSQDRRRIGWLSQSVNSSGTTQIHVATRADASSRTWSPHAWSCTGCVGLAFLGDQLLTVQDGTTLLGHPATGAAARTLAPTGLPDQSGESTDPGTINLLGSTTSDSEVLLFWTNGDLTENGISRLYRMAANGTTAAVSTDSMASVPAGDKAFTPTMAAISSDAAVVAYGGNRMGGDPCQSSDTVTVTTLDTGRHTTAPLPADNAHPWRITSVWIGAGHDVYASAYAQPGTLCTTPGGGSPPAGSVTPQVFRLTGGHWTKTNRSALAGAAGDDGWNAYLTGPLTLDPNTGNASSGSAAPVLVAASRHGTSRLGSSVTAFAWQHAATNPPPLLGTLWSGNQQGYGLPRPTTIMNGGDPTGLVTGAHWTSWGGKQATGTGTSTYPTTSVAAGTQEPVNIVAFDLGDCHGTRTYRAIEWYFPGKGGTFDPKNYINICTGDYVTSN